MGRDPEDYLYDLYAVCNHHGTMQGGHYTGNGGLSDVLNWLFLHKHGVFNGFVPLCVVAHCKNSIDGQWYCFDDSDVHPMSDGDVCKQTAYILFYQRRATIPSWSANSSVGGNLS